MKNPTELVHVYMKMYRIGRLLSEKYQNNYSLLPEHAVAKLSHICKVTCMIYLNDSLSLVSNV